MRSISYTLVIFLFKFSNTVPKTPLMNFEELFDPKFLASSIASLITTLYGVESLYINSNIAILNIFLSIGDI